MNPNFDISNYLIRNSKFLTKKLKLRLRTPFIINESKECLFLIKIKKHNILYSQNMFRV